ncbi:hypothetical protein FRB90_007844, partial [Tulasnella sp. 427]
MSNVGSVSGRGFEYDQAFEEIGFPLGRTNTAEVPPNAPLKLQLKRLDSWSQCFKKLDPHMEWLSQFMQKNNWITPEKLDRWNKLIEDYQKGRDQPPPSAFNELINGEGHRQARALYTRYQQLRKDLVDMATRRRSMKAAEQLGNQLRLIELEKEVSRQAEIDYARFSASFSDSGSRPSSLSRDSAYSSV